MQLAYIAPFDLLEPAGHVAHVRGAVGELARRAAVSLFALSCPEELRSRVEFVPVPATTRKGLQSVSFGASCSTLLARHLFGSPETVVYTRYFKSVLLPVSVAKLVRASVVVEVNSSLLNERRNAGISSLVARLEATEEQAVFRLADGAIAVTRAIEDEISRRHGSSRLLTRVVENGVDTGLYRPLARDACRRSLGFDVGGKYAVFAGAFQRWQGLPDLLRALALARREIPDLNLILIGDGPERAACTALIAELRLASAVTLCGFQEEARLVEYIACADVCVAPYNTDAADEAELDKRRYGARMRGSPLKIATYLACARPVITTHFAEAGAYLAEAGLGVAVPPEDPAALAAALVALLTNPSRGAELAERGLAVVQRDHGWSAKVDACLELVETVRRRRHRP